MDIFVKHNSLHQCRLGAEGIYGAHLYTKGPPKQCAPFSLALA